MNADRPWVECITHQIPGFEDHLFQLYAKRLLAFARARLPNQLSRRVDEDDIVQSVFRSFFRRNEAGEFSFDDSHDVWQLLAAITYRKVIKATRFHGRHMRAVQAEQSTRPLSSDAPSREPGPEDLAIMGELVEQLLSRLPEHHRAILQLRLDGCSPSEIATQMGISQRTVRRVMERTRDLVASELQ